MKFANEELEKGLLISLISNPVLIDDIADKISADTFTNAEYQQIYSESISKQYYQSGKISKTKTFLYIKKLNNKIADELMNNNYYAPLEIPEIVEELNKLKKQRKTEETLRTCYTLISKDENFLSTIQDKIFQVTSQHFEKNSIQDAETVAMKSWERLGDRQNGKADNVIKTGYRSLDNIVRFKRSHLTAIGADTSVGKTAFTLNLARSVLETSNEPTLIFSLEQESEEVMDRLLIQKSKVCADDYYSTQRKLTEQQHKAVSYALNWIHDKPLKIIDERGMTIEEIKTYSRQAYRQFNNNMGFIIVDYLQEIVLTDYNNLTREIGRVVQSLRNLGKELNCHVILLSQLSRKFDNREDKRPRRSDLRYSAEIEQVSDNIIMLYRPEVYEKREPGDIEPLLQPDAEAIVAKQRGGKTPTIAFTWYPEILYFQDAQDYQPYNGPINEINYLKQEG